MKNATLSLCFVVSFSLLTKAQDKTFSIGSPSPNTNAAMHVEAPTNNQGMLMPRLTTVQRIAMSLTTTDIGLQLYDTDLKGIFLWDEAT